MIASQTSTSVQWGQEDRVREPAARWAGQSRGRQPEAGNAQTSASLTVSDLLPSTDPAAPSRRRALLRRFSGLGLLALCVGGRKQKAAEAELDEFEQWEEQSGESMEIMAVFDTPF